MSTIEIYVSAVSHYFVLHGLAPPWEQPLFKATMGGIKRDMGGKAKKKPPVEAWHIAELLSWDTRPANWTPQMWWQGKAILYCAVSSCSTGARTFQGSSPATCALMLKA